MTSGHKGYLSARTRDSYTLQKTSSIILAGYGAAKGIEYLRERADEKGKLIVDLKKKKKKKEPPWVRVTRAAALSTPSVLLAIHLAGNTNFRRWVDRKYNSILGKV